MNYHIAVIPGDGIGKEVVPEGLKVLAAAGDRFGIGFRFHHFDWSCETYKTSGRMMPADGIARLRDHDAIFLGAVGFPGVPDHVSLWGLLLPIRREFDQYVNLRPTACSRGLFPRSAIASPATSTSGSCARIPKGSIHKLVAGCTQEPQTKSWCRRRCSLAAALTV